MQLRYLIALMGTADKDMKRYIISFCILLIVLAAGLVWYWYQTGEAKILLCLPRTHQCAFIRANQLDAPQATNCITVKEVPDSIEGFSGGWCRPDYRIFMYDKLQRDLKDSCATIAGGVVSEIDDHTYKCTGPGGDYTNDLMDFTSGWIIASSTE